MKTLRRRSIQKLFFILVFVAFITIFIKILCFHVTARSPEVYVNYLPHKYREGANHIINLLIYLLDMPIYLKEQFYQYKNDYEQFGHFGLVWKPSMHNPMCKTNSERRIQPLKVQNAASGRVFSGEKIRWFDRTKAKFNRKSIPVYSQMPYKYKGRFNCSKWGVVTTIFEPPSEAIRRFLYRKNWCVVVVGDRGMPTKVYIYI